MKKQHKPMSPAIPLSVVLLILAGLFLLLGLSAGRVDSTPSRDVLEVISVDAARSHRVAPGTTTTFVLRANNPAPAPVSATVALTGRSDPWQAVLTEGDIWYQPKGEGGATLEIPSIGAGEERLIVVSLTPPVSTEIGQVGTFEVSASLSSGHTGSVTVRAVVHDRPKIYLLCIDGLSRQYADLGLRGEADPEPGSLLMPNTRAFLAESASFPRARCALPAMTDMSMYSLYSGSWPGTAGVGYVAYFFRGWDGAGRKVWRKISRDELRYGSEGLPVLSLFDVAKDPAYGGDPDTFTAIISGKYWLNNLFRTWSFETNLDILADGLVRPDYMNEPQPYRLGDPLSDPDAATDRDGVNLYPLSELRMHGYGYTLLGDNPQENPPDRWLASNALRVVAAEDPDVFAVHLGNVDKIHHGAGAAADPREWYDPGTPDVLWDDFSVYNRYANREPVIDTVREADLCIGRILDVLRTRGVYDDAVVVLFSDHGGITYTSTEVDARPALDAAGVADKVRWITTYSDSGNLYLWNLADAAAVEAALEGYTVHHPVWQREVHPFVVITREEMNSGLDSVVGRFGRDGGPLRGEMYSEWFIDYPAADNSKVVWPDMFIYAIDNFQLKNTTVMDTMVGGHSGFSTMPTLLAVRGPAFQQGAFDSEDSALVDVTPTLYHVMGWTAPGNVDGRVLHEILRDGTP